MTTRDPSEDHRTPAEVVDEPSELTGYTYGGEPGPQLATSPLTLDELAQLVATVGLEQADRDVLTEAARILGPQADQMVTDWRARIAEHQFLARYSGHPDGSANPAYGAASKPRFDRWIIDACTRPLDQDWLNYQHEIGLRHTRAKKNHTDHADSLDYIPMRFVLAFTAFVLVTSREYLARGATTTEDLDRMHAAFTKSVLLHVTVWTRAYDDPDQW